MNGVPLSARGRLAAWAALALFLTATPALPADGPDAYANEILRSMSSFLAAQKTFSVSANMSAEVITQEGQKLQLDSRSDLVMERPSHFYSSRRGRFADVELFFDGSRVVIYGKSLRAYTQLDVSGTVDDAISALESVTGLGLPASDLLLSDPYAALASGVTSSGYYGRAFVQGVECHHLAFRKGDVDWQLWVKVGDEPLPMKYVITTKWTTGAPQYSVELVDWNLKPVIPAGRFKFVPAADAVRVQALKADDTGEIVGPQEGTR